MADLNRREKRREADLNARGSARVTACEEGSAQTSTPAAVLTRTNSVKLPRDLTTVSTMIPMTVVYFKLKDTTR